MAKTSCWLCGAPAGSREHRLKKSDIVRAYGPGPYRGDHAPMHVRGDDRRVVQGPNSNRLKYAPSLCEACNTTRTQPYDRAYDRFTEWVFRNESLVLRRRFINFGEVFGEHWAEHQLHLYRYFAKSFGCHLVEAGLPVPVDVVELFEKATFRTDLWLSFAVNEDIVLMPPEDRNGFIGMAGLLAWIDRADPSVVNGYEWNEHVSWLSTIYSYGAPPDGDLGSPWVANAQHVYLGSFAPLSDEQRAKFEERIRARTE
jgi:hypothetical protein